MVETLVLTIGAKANKFGPAFQGVETGTWYASGKFTKDKDAVDALVESLIVGEKVEAAVSAGKYLNSVRRLNETGPVPTPTALDRVDSGPSPRALENKAKTDAQISRSTAVKAVMGSPLLADQWKDLDAAESLSRAKDVMKQMENYILTGEFTNATAPVS